MSRIVHITCLGEIAVLGSDRKWRSREALAALIRGHLARYPAAEPRDIYKLLYQGVLGPEHLIASPDAFAARLHEELGPLEPTENEPLWEPLRPDGLLGRLNLRPYKARGGDSERLVEACLRTAYMRWGTPGELRRAWDTFTILVREGTWPAMSLGRVEVLTRYLVLHGYPAMHHSSLYRRSHAPAYRLVATRWTGMLRVLGFWPAL